MLGSFGSIVFETSDKKILTYDEFERNNSNRYAKHNSLGVKPKTEYIGPELETISFSMVLRAALGIDVDNTLEELRRIRDTPEVNKLIVGGKLIGTNFIIKSMSEKHDVVDNKGQTQKATVSIELEEYILDIPKSTVKAVYKKSIKKSNKTGTKKSIPKKNVLKKPVAKNKVQKEMASYNKNMQLERIAMQKATNSNKNKYSSNDGKKRIKYGM